MKYIGVLLVAAAGIGLGLYYARRLYQRVEWLRRMEGLLAAMAGRLRYTAAPMADLWRDFAAGEVYGNFPLVRDTVAGLDRSPFAAAFADAVARETRRAALQPEDRRILEEFGAGCGHTGLIEQLDHFRTAREQLALARQEAEKQAAARGQVYQMMGVAGGVGLALLLL